MINLQIYTNNSLLDQLPIIKRLQPLKFDNPSFSDNDTIAFSNSGSKKSSTKLISPLILFNDPSVSEVQNNLSEAIPSKLANAAISAYNKNKNIKGNCEATAIDLHKKLLGKQHLSVRSLPKAANLNEHGKPISYLKDLIDSGKLKPGMLIFINTVPGMSLKNLKPSDRHWFTYMGRDHVSNKPVFQDQYGTARGLDKILKLKHVNNPDVKNRNERKIHTIFDPYAGNRSELLGN